MSKPKLPAIGRRVGPYRVEALLGAGASAEVFRAQHTQLARRSAIKIFGANVIADPVAMERFKREASALVSVQHENVVRLLDFGVMEDRPYLVMEWIDGSTLLDEMNAGMVRERAIVLAAQVSRGLAAIHEAGVVHRDLKPANIMVAAGPPECAKVVDFGIARGAGFATVTAVESIVGTPLYMAPELITKAPLSPQTDLYALGVILYEALTGTPHVGGCDIITIIAQQIEAIPAALEPQFGPLGALVDRMLEKSPADRPASASAVAEELENLVRRPPSKLRIAEWRTDVIRRPNEPESAEDVVVPVDLTAGDRAMTPAAEAFADTVISATTSPAVRPAGAISAGGIAALFVLAILVGALVFVVWPKAEMLPVVPHDLSTEVPRPVRVQPLAPTVPTPVEAPESKSAPRRRTTSAVRSPRKDAVEPPPIVESPVPVAPVVPVAPSAAALQARRNEAQATLKRVMNELPGGVFNSYDRRLLNLGTEIQQARTDDERRTAKRHLDAFIEALETRSK